MDGSVGNHGFSPPVSSVAGGGLSLTLGVVDTPYAAPGKSTTTTGDVAQILEDKYHVMQIFAIENEAKIASLITEAALKEIARVASGKGRSDKPFFGATQKIDEAFRDFLDSGQMEAIMPITQPIAAAQMGVNHRKKAGYNKGREARPAFIDTGLYQQSFTSWVHK